MDRQIVYPGEIPLDTDVLAIQRNVLIALGFQAQGAFGTATQVFGLAGTPTSPASMQVQVGPGAIVANTVLDQSAFGSLAADTADALVKLGINLTATNLTLTAPLSAGQSIAYLIEAAFSETDATPVVLPYYNAANPSQPYTGPANSGASQNTQRLARVQIQAKAGAPANTGSQTTPAVDAGWVGLYVVTVAYAATSITSANIVVAQGAPFIGGGSLQPGRLMARRWFKGPLSTVYTPTPGTNRIRWRASGGGASGGGVPTTSAGQAAAATGGTSGSYSEGEATTGFAGAALTVGAGGAAPTAGANAGNAGGLTSLGTLFSCPGGVGGQAGFASSSPFINSAPGQPPVPTGSGDLDVSGSAGPSAICPSLSPLYVGGAEGGRSGFGPGPAGAGQNSGGSAAVSPGAGGSGACSANGGPYAGGAGAAGLLIIDEYSA